MNKEKTEDRRIQTLSLESSFSSCIHSPSNLNDTLLKNIFISFTYVLRQEHLLLLTELRHNSFIPRPSITEDIPDVRT